MGNFASIIICLAFFGVAWFTTTLKKDIYYDKKVSIIGLIISIVVFFSILLYGIYATPYNPSGCSNCGNDNVFANGLCENCWNSMVDDFWYDN